MSKHSTVWLEWVKRLQAISQSGLTYAKDVYDIERYEQLRDLSLEMMNKYTDMEIEQIRDLFAGETGYATPKVDIRGVVFRNDRILMVREKSDGGWSLPGGWADIGISPGETATKEIKEESGFDTTPARLLAVLDKAKHNHPPSAYHIYKIFIRCEIVGGQASGGMETSDVRFFSEDSLPPLSLERNTEFQIKLMFEFLKDPGKAPVFD
ncbi:NUDIX hydrolase [Paenibacillus alkalitolerans]|uniref:NUDIX hydrolase n=1 Tax=Paenibacillus alkalitolerans TaxID=2799335 RepID=UPI0018F557C4|nr:NUDIX hydrolase [Paenibacillus alkalitolerans]